MKGKARAFEGAFVVEVRKDGKLLARQPVQAEAGAPAYGDFAGSITVPGGIPEGSEAWFLLTSPKDGADQVELIAPIYPYK